MRVWTGVAICRIRPIRWSLDMPPIGSSIWMISGHAANGYISSPKASLSLTLPPRFSPLTHPLSPTLIVITGSQIKNNLGQMIPSITGKAIFRTAAGTAQGAPCQKLHL